MTRRQRIALLGAKVLQVALVCAALFHGSAMGQGLISRPFPIEKHGTLELTAPEHWKDTVKKGPRFLPPKIEFSPASGQGFLIQITPGGPQLSGLGRGNPAEVRKRVEEAGHRLLSRAMEANLALRELVGDGVWGIYFSLTDKAPKPGEYRHLTQGIALVGDLPLAFTILYNDPELGEQRAALEMLSKARLTSAR